MQIYHQSRRVRIRKKIKIGERRESVSQSGITFDDDTNDEWMIGKNKTFTIRFFPLSAEHQFSTHAS